MSVVSLSGLGKQVFGSQLRRNMMAGAGVMVINIAIMALSYPIYLHHLGYEKYGVWLVLATVLTFMQMGGNLGLGPAVTKLVAEEYGRQNLRGIQSYVMMALVLLTSSAALCAVVILVFRSQIIRAFKLAGDNAQVASGLLPYVGILCVYAFVVNALSATLSGVGRMDLDGYCRTTGRAITLGVSILLLRIGWGIESLLVANVVAYMIVHIIIVLLVHRIIRVRLLQLGNWDVGRLKTLLRFGTGIMGGSFLNMLLNPFSKLMISRYAGVSAIPVYDLAFTSGMQGRSVIEAGLKALMPEMSRIRGEWNDTAAARLRSIYGRAVRLVVLLGTPALGLGMVLVAYTPLLRFWLRDKFVEQLPEAVCIMLLATILSLLGVPAYYTLMGLGKVRHIVISHAVMVFLNVLPIVGAALLWGQVSVANVLWSTVLGMGGSTLYLVYQRRRLLPYLCTAPAGAGPQIDLRCGSKIQTR